MKNRHLKREFEIHMLITLLLIAVASIATFLGCNYGQSMILPNQATIYIDTVSTFADGREAKQTYSLDWSEIDGQMIMKKQNEINGEEISQSQLEGGNKNYILFTSGKEEDTDLVIRDLSEMSEEETSKMLIDNGQIQTGEQIRVSKIENSLQKLSPEARAKYEMLSWMKIVFPILYSILGVWASGYIFYRSKIAAPIATLEEAAGKIAKQTLDFTVESDSRNELGRLCDSFEEMRSALEHNNQELLSMMEQKRMLQSSVAHDLRNPIAIMKGYAQLIQNGIGKKVMSEEQVVAQLKNVEQTAERMAYYVESMHEVNHLEDLTLTAEQIDLKQYATQLREDMEALVEENGLEISVELRAGEATEWMLDKQALARILENLVQNSMRYAKKQIRVVLEEAKQGTERTLCITVSDDGKGYPQKVLQQKDLYFYTTEEGAHMGMGMVVSRILARKHGGELKLMNAESGGAKTQIIIKELTNI